MFDFLAHFILCLEKKNQLNLSFKQIARASKYSPQSESVW